MAVNLSFIGGAGWQFFDDSGNPLSGGKIYTYAAGTTTPQATYTSRTGLIPNTNPIILDAAGRTPEEVWSTEGLLYKYVVADANDVVIRTWDGIGGSVVASDLAANLASTSNNSLGDALVGFKQSNSAGFLTNAIGKTVNDKLQEVVSVKDFGATGDGVTDDTHSIWNAIQAINDAGGGALYFPSGTYLITYNVKADITSTAPWANSFKAVAGLNEFTLVFCNCDGLKIYGDNATIKSKDNGIPLGTTTGYEWGMMCLRQCSNVQITGLTLDGNRANQNHTIGVNAGHNHGIYADGSNSYVWIYDNIIKNTGSLRPGVDKRGDGVYFSNGDSYIVIDDNYIENVGRWAVVLEAGSGSTTDFYVLRNRFKSSQRGVDPLNTEVLGFVDIETQTSYNGIYIEDNIVWNGVGVISFGGNTGGAPRTVTNIRITGNTFNNLSGGTGYDKFISMSSGGSVDPNIRIFENVIIANNQVTNTGVNAMLGFIDVQACRVSNYVVRNNNFVDLTSGSVANADKAGVRFYYTDLANNCFVENNLCHRTGGGVLCVVPTAYTGASNFKLYINNNTLTTCHVSILLNNNNTDFASSYYYVTKNTSIGTSFKDSDFNSGNIVIYEDNNIWNGGTGPQYYFGVSGYAVTQTPLTNLWYGSIGRQQGWFRTRPINASTSTVILRILRSTARPAVYGTIMFAEQNFDQNAARMTIDYNHYGGAWFAATPTVVTKSNAGFNSPTITINGEYLDIAWQKTTGTNNAILVYDLNMIYCTLEIPQA